MHESACPIPFNISELTLVVTLGLAGAGIEEQGAAFAASREIKHLDDRVGNCVEGPLADAVPLSRAMR